MNRKCLPCRRSRERVFHRLFEYIKIHQRFAAEKIDLKTARGCPKRQPENQWLPRRLCGHQPPPSGKRAAIRKAVGAAAGCSRARGRHMALTMAEGSFSVLLRLRKQPLLPQGADFIHHGAVAAAMPRPRRRQPASSRSIRKAPQTPPHRPYARCLFRHPAQSAYRRMQMRITGYPLYI